MKFNNLLISVLLSAGMVGCGGGSESLDAGTAPQPVQRTLSGGTESSAQTDAQQTSVVSIAGYRDNYTIVKDQTTNVVTATSKIDNSVKTYQKPSLIKFVDKWISFDIDGPSGQIYRLYQAAFNRQPDLPGLGFWIKAHENGRAIIDIASDFVVSAEFKTMYGDKPANLKLVNAFYNNVLRRDGEQAGLDWWVGQMDNGAATYGVLYGFSDSAENKSNLNAAMQSGFDYVPFTPGGAIVPQGTSYANMKGSGFVAEDLSRVLPGDAYAFADFFGEGTQSIVAHTLEYSPQDISTKNKFGHIKFFQRINGAWSDNTSKLLTDNVGCLHPRKAVVADFNGDGKPDIFFACHGWDAPPFPGEQQVLLLSQTDGTYKKSKTSFDCFCHGASAAVLNRQGYADILVADQTVEKRPYFLINNGDGTFSKDFTRLPDLSYKQIWTAELIDVNHDGKVDAFLSGADVQGDGYQIYPTVFINDGSNHFVSKRIEIPVVPIKGYATLDFALDGNVVYLLRTDYNSMVVQKTDLTTMSSADIYKHAGNYTHSPWFAWFTVQGDNLATFDSSIGFNISK